MAHRLLAVEWNEQDTAAEKVAATGRVLRHLQDHLARWLGQDGAKALLARGLDQARADHPTLAGARVEPRGGQALAGLVERAGDREPAEVVDALVAIVTAVVALLTRLIGADMAMRILQQAWPDRIPDEIREASAEQRVAAPENSMTMHREDAPGE